MNELLVSINNIGYPVAALCILKGLRAKLELHRKQKNRITKHFPALKGIVLTGRAGCGKTHTMRQIYTGLQLDKFNKDGVSASCWIDGAATVVGRREKFKENAHSILWWNEMNVNDIQDVRLLKQLSEGLISYMKHGDLEETNFTGLLIASTNDFSARGKVGRDLEALRDRLDIIEVGPPQGYDPKLAIETENHYLRRKNSGIDWELIANSLSIDTDEVLSNEELSSIRPYWLLKIKECLDDKILTRAGADYLDCFIFMKRLFKNYGGLSDKNVFNAALDLANTSINLNPVSITNLTITQRDIICALEESPNKTCSTNEIKDKLVESGRFLSKSTMHRSISKLVEQGLIIKRRHGEYSMIRNEPVSYEVEESIFGEILDELI